jgi:hypothetical protein
MIGWWILLAAILTPVVAWLFRTTDKSPENPDKLRGRRLLSSRELAELHDNAPPDDFSYSPEKAEIEDDEEEQP